MTSPRKARTLAACLALFAAVTLAGCAAVAPESTGNFPTPTPTSAQTVTPTASAAPTSAPIEPSDEADALTQSELTQICIDATTSAFGADVEFAAAGVRVEQRKVSPEWLVLVPARTMGYDGEAQCTIGGSAADPDIDMAAASIERLSEDQIQRIIRGEDAGTP